MRDKGLQFHYGRCQVCGGKVKVHCGAITTLQKLATWLKSCPLPPVFKKIKIDALESGQPKGGQDGR